MDSLISTFHIDWHLILAQAVNFIVVIFVLWRFALKPLAKLMDERGKTIAGGLTDAETNKKMLAKTEAEYAEALNHARKEASVILTDAKKDAEVKRGELLEKAKSDAQKVIADGMKSLENEKMKMLDDAKKELAQMVVSATEKVLEGTITPKIEASLVEKSINEVK